MALSTEAKAHLDSITDAANAAVTALGDDDQVVKDRPALNMRDAIVAAVDAQVALEDWSDLPA